MGLVGGGQAIYRWEGNHSRPRPRQQTALVAAIGALNPAIAAELAKLFATDPGSARPKSSAATSGGVVPQTAADNASSSAHAPGQLDPATTLELALLRMADELDVPPRRLRDATQRFLETLGAAHFSTEGAHRAIVEWAARVAHE
jgi:hypothetical protein